MKKFPNINIISIGKQVPNWAQTAIDNYQKRIQAQSIKWVLVDYKQSKKQQDQIILEQENKLLLSKIPQDTLCIALDKSGESWTNEKLTNIITQSISDSQSITFVIGGSLGLNQMLLNQSDHIWSLSKLVFPHSLARVILIEQLYRSFSYLNSHPYHRP